MPVNLDFFSKDKLKSLMLLFHKKIATVPPGLHMKMPWPIDKVYHVPVQRIQSLEFGFETSEPGRKTVFASQTTDDLEVAEMLTGIKCSHFCGLQTSWRKKLFKLLASNSDQIEPKCCEADFRSSVKISEYFLG